MRSNVFAVALVVGLLSSCAKVSERRQFEQGFERAVELASKTNETSLQIFTLTPFAWDRIFFFHPYTAPSAIDAVLGSTWKSAVKGDLEFDDGYELLVFVRNRKVVQYAKIKRCLGDWELDNYNGLRPEEAVLRVKPAKGHLTFSVGGVLTEVKP
jgi:hypothetical protein